MCLDVAENTTVEASPRKVLRIPLLFRLSWGVNLRSFPSRSGQGGSQHPSTYILYLGLMLRLLLFLLQELYSSLCPPEIPEYFHCLLCGQAGLGTRTSNFEGSKRSLAVGEHLWEDRSYGIAPSCLLYVNPDRLNGHQLKSIQHGKFDQGAPLRQ